MKKALLLTLFCLSFTAVNAAVRWNPAYNMWEGNICMNNVGWQIVQWQPIGSLCWLNLPKYGKMQGIIINN